MSSENAIHIKLDYIEAIKAKRNLLSSELSSLNIAKKIGRYRVLRLEELGLKSKVYGKMKEAKSEIRKLQNFLPNLKIPRILKRGHVTEKPSGAERELHQEGDIEFQLREIQRRLEELQNA